MARKPSNASSKSASRTQRTPGGAPLGAPRGAPGRAAGPRPIGMMARMRAYFLAGVLVTAPAAITFYLGWLLIDFIDSRMTPLIPAQFNPETYLPFGVPGIGVLLLVIVLIVIGWAAAGYLGRMMLKTTERAMSRMPVVRSIYAAVKQILETVLANQSNAFRQVVLIEYPRRGIWAIGFVSGETQGEVQNITSRRVLNVFLPTTPNPTSGFLLFLPEDEVHVLDMTIEEGIKMVVSGGIVTPPDRRPPEVKEAGPVVDTPTPPALPAGKAVAPTGGD